MKRFITMAVSAIALILALAGCSGEEKSLQDIYNNAIEASNELNSYQMDMNMDMDMSMPGIPAQKTTITTKGKVVIDPMALHQTMEIMGQSVEMYYTENGMYMQQPGTDQWVKAPKSMMDQLTQMSQAQQKPGEQLEQLKKYVEDFNLEEKENSFVLSVSSSEDKMKGFVKEMLKQNLPNNAINDDVLKNISIKKLDYKFTVNKDNYYPKALDLSMDLEIEQNGEKSIIKEKIHATYSKYNEIEEITVPEEVKNNAQEMPMGPS
ncbi:DUF6612 family protein [Pontibacillus sp. HMF3514]|uniref:DUF6612 family protein n=1 Tax=Pontibacillus sp. HMF3514 TaxID=2692425 RepID=UPI00131F66C7|nr:DUF6612 family protein [Pontibacillus sp. HMF3514]QHE53334.1 hypothetical protein GS400_15505 [Pontibacillus sp. HMF3514]